jgi:benzoyl-CoA reductase/2-hydroxyglutaryl-CoA dehydratase subunit BcrC/BadD/HgdB
MAFAKAEKTFQASVETSKFVREDYKYMYAAKKEGKKTAWMTGITPVEMFEATEIVSVFPENYNAFASAKQMGADLCQEAEMRGFSQDICSYGRLCLGYCLSGKGPYGSLPDPDILICTRNACATHVKWWEAMSHIFNKPLFILDIPEIHDKPTKAQTKYFMTQLEDLKKFIKETTGQTVKDDRLEETVALSQRTSELWGELTEMRKKSPCPISSTDVFNQMFLTVTKPATKRANDILTQLVGEVKAFVAQGKGVVEHERFRLMWDNIAIWYNLGLMNYLQKAGAVSVIETYSSHCGWGKLMDMSQGPAHALASKYMPGYLNLDLNSKVKLMQSLAKDFRLDGALLFSNRSCKPYSVGQYDIKIALEKVGVKSVMFEADMVDQRAYAEETINNRLEAFLEMLENDKRAK